MVTVSTAIEGLLDTLDLDATGAAHAAIASKLAARLDESGEGDTGAMTAQLSKELRAVIATLIDANGEAQSFTNELFAND